MIINLSYNREADRENHVAYLNKEAVLLDPAESIRVREDFINNFINTASEHYRKYISSLNNKKTKFYSGYLWNSLKEYKRALPGENLSFLDKLVDKNVYVMSDLHSRERLVNNETLLPFFSVELVMAAKLNDILLCLAALAQDVYIFDDSFSWYLILTHEFDADGSEIYYREK